MGKKLTSEQTALYERILQFRLDQPGVDCPFSAKLAWQYGWSGVFTFRAIREYKKFIFLIMVSALPLSPATVIDRVWHQHILYTRSYWNDFCGGVLGRQVHHTPGLGGEAEGKKYYQQCENAITLYKQYFGHPPTDIWNSPQLTVETLEYQWIDTNKNWIIPKPNFPRKIQNKMTSYNTLDRTRRPEYRSHRGPDS